MFAPKVSVLIPTFNRADFLPAALESVLRQTYTDYEIVVVDDGSTDDTKDVLRSYAGRIRYIRCERGGPARARNVGFEAARGEYLCLLDSDDLYYEHKLELQVDHLDRHPDSVMVYTEFSAFAAGGFSSEFHLRSYHHSAYKSPANDYDRLFSERSRLSENRILSRAAEVQNAPHWLSRAEYRGDIFEAYLRNTIVFTNSMMLRRETLEAVGPQNPYFGHFHDLEFALRVCKHGKVAFIDNPTYKLRLHAGQVSAINKADGGRNAVKLQRDLLRVARKHAFVGRQRSREMNRVIGRLCRAVAQPLLAYDGDNPHRRALYSRKAREYLAYAWNHGCPWPSLYVMSLLPSLARRLFFASERRLRRLRETLGARTA